MHGLILAELKRFADSHLGPAAWHGLLQEAGLGKRLYVPSGKYPDDEVIALAEILARRRGTDVQSLLSEFGEFIVPTLAGTYKSYIRPEWKTLEMIENTEANIHRAARAHDPSSTPPELEVHRVSLQQVVVTYRSKRKLCSLAKGIIRGVAAHYGETVEIREMNCMLQKMPVCTITVTLVYPPSNAD